MQNDTTIEIQTTEQTVRATWQTPVLQVVELQDVTAGPAIPGADGNLN